MRSVGSAAVSLLAAGLIIATATRLLLCVQVSLLQQLRVWLLRLRSSVQGISETMLATSGSRFVDRYPWLVCRQHADLRCLLDPKGQWLQQAFDVLAILDHTNSRTTANEPDEQQQQQQQDDVQPSDEDPDVEQVPQQMQPAPR